MKVTLKNVLGLVAALAGLVLIIAGLSVTNVQLEQIVNTEPGRTLAWGTTLFRSLLVVHGVTLTSIATWWLIRRRREMESAIQSDVSADASANEDENSRSTWLTLGCLGVIALSLRLWQLNTDLWYDELLTLLNYVRAPLGQIVSRLPDQNNHPLFSVLSHASVQVFGESAWAVRLPSVAFGVLSIWALFLLGRRTIGKRESILAAGLMTVSYHHIWFSQNARGYMGLLLFSLLATWLWLEANRRGKWAWFIAYAMAVTAGMWTHLTMAFVVAAHALVYLLALFVASRRPRAEDHLRALGAFVLSASLTLQLYALALPEFLSVGLHEVSLESEWTNPWWVISETFRNLQIGFAGAVVVIGGAVMLGVGFLDMCRRHWQSGVLMVLPALLAAGVMIGLGHNLWPRFFFFCMGFALLIAVHGAMVLPRVLNRWFAQKEGVQSFSRRLGTAFASLMIFASVLTIPRNYAYPKQDFSGARDFVESKRGPNDAIVAVGLAGVAYKNYFAPTWSFAQTRAELDTLRRERQDVWLVYTLPVEVRAYRRDIWQSIENDFALVRSFPGTLGGGDVYVCHTRAASTLSRR